MYIRVWYIRLITTLFLLLGTVQIGYGQARTYLTGSVNPANNGGRYNEGLLGFGGAQLQDPDNANTSNESTFSTLRAEKLIALGLPLGQADVRLHIRNGSNTILQVNRPVYFKIKEKPTTNGLSIDLGTLLGLVEAVSIKGELFTGATNPTPHPISANPNFGVVLPNTKDQVLIDKLGEYYFSVTPPMGQTFNAARLSVEMPSSALTLVDVSNTILRVYNVFQLSDGDICDTKPIYTDPGEQDGLSVDLSALKLLSLGEILTNPQHAIDDNTDSFSALSAGLLSVGNYVAQTFFFNHLATASDGLKFKMSLPAGLLGVDLLQNISFQPYNGASAVGNPIELSTDILGIDLLGIPLVGGGDYTVPLEFIVKPNVQFDQIKIKFNSTLGVGGVIVGGSLRIHDVSLAPAVPTILEAGQPDDLTICEGEEAIFSVHATVPVGTPTYQWQYYNGTTWANVSGSNVSGATTPELTLSNVPLSYDGRQYRVQVTGGNMACPQIIYSEEANLNVNLMPGKPHVTISEIVN